MLLLQLLSCTLQLLERFCNNRRTHHLNKVGDLSKRLAWGKNENLRLGN